MWKRLCGALTITGLGFAGLLTIAVGNAAAAEIRFLCAAALQPAMDELVPAFQKASGHTVNIRFANISVNTASVRSGEPADLVVVSPGQWTELAKEGKLDAATQVTIAKVGLGVFVKKGAAKPDIGSTAAFTNAFSNARAIAIPVALNNPVGNYATRLFDKLGVTADFDRKNVIRGGGSPLQAVARGDAELGFTQISEIIAAPEVELVGPFPAEIQNWQSPLRLSSNLRGRRQPVRFSVQKVLNSSIRSQRSPLLRHCKELLR
jgi:molybdate transport system substrate-binding protein